MIQYRENHGLNRGANVRKYTLFNNSKATALLDAKMAPMSSSTIWESSEMVIALCNKEAVSSSKSPKAPKDCRQSTSKKLGRNRLASCAAPRLVFLVSALCTPTCK